MFEFASLPVRPAIIFRHLFGDLLDNGLFRFQAGWCGQRGEIRIEVGQRGHRPLLSVTDTGSGMDAAFVRDRLFRPFDTTKGSKGMGIGAYQAREFARSLSGDVEVESSPGAGTRFSLILPVVS